MKRSSPTTTGAGVGVPFAAGLASLDLVARLCVPASLLLLALGRGSSAMIAAAAVSGLAVVRGVVAGHAIERAVRHAWGQLVEATERHDALALQRRPPSWSVTVLIEAAHRAALVRATTVPRLLADAIGLVLVAAVVGVRLGLAWLLAGAAALVVVGAVVAVVQRRLRGAEQRAWDELGALVRDFEVLLDAAVELRAHGRDRSFGEETLARATRLAHLQRRVGVTSSLVGLLPLGVALLAATAPLAGLVGGPDAWLVVPVAEAGILGATGLVLALGLTRGLEELVRSAPQRASLAAFLAAAPGDRLVHESGGAAPDFEDDLVLDGVSVRHPGSDWLTPGPASYRWPARGGVAVLGPNGAGKSSLALALLGLVPFHTGQVRLGETPLDPAVLRLRTVYVPQQPFVASSGSVAWHLRLLSNRPLDDEALEAALAEVGLGEALAAHVGSSTRLSAVYAGELSGGERRRMHLARALLAVDDRQAVSSSRRVRRGDADPSRTELVVLDEPEAGLDAAGRARLRAWAEQLSGSCRVLLIAHDASVVPASFDRLDCTRAVERSPDPPSQRVIGYENSCLVGSGGAR